MGYTGPLADKDRIFTNLYGFQGADLKAAQARGDWDGTADLIKRGEDDQAEHDELDHAADKAEHEEGGDDRDEDGGDFHYHWPR